MEASTETNPTVTETTAAPAVDATTSAAPTTAAETTPSYTPEPLFSDDADNMAVTDPQTTTEAKPEAPTEEAPRPEWLKEKYKTPEDQAKAYAELEKKFMEKRGIPETYELTSIIEESGLTISDESAFKALSEDLKGHEFTQTQSEFLVKLGGEWIRNVLTSYGPVVDANKERTTLTETWGADAKSKANEVQKWATASLPRDVINKPLYATAEGMLFLESLMAKGRGPTPITGTAASVTDADTLMGQARALIGSPDYNGNSAGARATQEKARQLIEQAEKMRK